MLFWSVREIGTRATVFIKLPRSHVGLFVPIKKKGFHFEVRQCCLWTYRTQKSCMLNRPTNCQTCTLLLSKHTSIGLRPFAFWQITQANEHQIQCMKWDTSLLSIQRDTPKSLIWFHTKQHRRTVPILVRVGRSVLGDVYGILRLHIPTILIWSLLSSALLHMFADWFGWINSTVTFKYCMSNLKTWFQIRTL